MEMGKQFQLFKPLIRLQVNLQSYLVNNSEKMLKTEVITTIVNLYKVALKISIIKIGIILIKLLKISRDKL